MDSSSEGKRFLLEKDGMMDTFSIHNHISVTRLLKDGSAEGELEVGPESLNIYGVVHGGCLATLADTVGGCCACSKGGICVTASSTMEFLRPANGSAITCVATPKKLGRTLSVVQVELFNDNQTLVATGTFTFFMVEPPQK